MTRDEAVIILKKYLTNENLIKHCLAAEVAMKAIYRKLQTDPTSYSKSVEDTWGITGLLHDADYEMSKGHPEAHGLLLFEKEPNVFPADIEYAIKAHNPDTGIEPKKPMDWAIRCCDQLTGLIVASALIHPDKKLASITPEFVLNRMMSKSFAKGAKREPIYMCETKLLIPLPEFVDLVLKAMQGISNDLGL